VIGDKPSLFPKAARLLAAACRETGDYARAIQLEREVDLANAKDPAAVNAKYDTLKEAYHEGGKLGYWQQLLELSKGETNPVKLAALYARVDRKAEAFEYLHLAYTNAPTQLVFQINREQAFDTLRNEPAFAELLRNLGIPRDTQVTTKPYGPTSRR
jgi:hypothetical protein